ncbi:unnamed protein product [Bursaphelenchus xylophilus]|uniref:(pine wood nematode) hypothetical protein n=1 Tax=Bursaphelenchus xylophilus TaxID=6326 RepID=A0A1I7RHF8_BURXY|nr:unnamed protein product [Bursaphelenchus xylophilus]CAG9115784.1 unnamed protein product [Bursaphelenchus xylophilus]
MSGEPASKRQKLEGGSKDGFDEATQKYLEELDKVQGELDVLNEKASAEIIEIEKKYNQLRSPFFEDRQKLIEKIPNFWVTVFTNHPLLNHILSEQDEEALHYLSRLDVVEDFADGKNGFKLKFSFDLNPFFTNSDIVKEMTTPPNGEPQATCTKIDWKPNKDLTMKKDSGFFSWLADVSEPADEIAEVLKDEVWVNPVQYFLMPDLNGDAEDSDIEPDEDDLQE